MAEIKMSKPNIEVKTGGKDGLVEMIDFLIGRPSENEIDLNQGIEMNKEDYLKLECPNCKKEIKFSRSEMPAKNVICDCGQEIIKYY